MNQAAPDSTKGVTFNGFDHAALSQAGMPVPDFTAPGAFEALAEGFIALSGQLGGLFDTLVIDEGQDFAPAWVEALLRLAGPNSRVLWLEDPDQTLYPRPAVPLPGWPVLRSPVNYRSPRRLVDFINALGLTPAPLQAGGAFDGFDPRWLEHDQDADPVAVTAEAVREPLDQRHQPARPVVLSSPGPARTRLPPPHAPTTHASPTPRLAAPTRDLVPAAPQGGATPCRPGPPPLAVLLDWVAGGVVVVVLARGAVERID